MRDSRAGARCLCLRNCLHRSGGEGQDENVSHDDNFLGCLSVKRKMVMVMVMVSSAWSSSRWSRTFLYLFNRVQHSSRYILRRHCAFFIMNEPLKALFKPQYLDMTFIQTGGCKSHSSSRLIDRLIISRIEGQALAKKT